jgi:hypothetical protein
MNATCPKTMHENPNQVHRIIKSRRKSIISHENLHDVVTSRSNSSKLIGKSQITRKPQSQHINLNKYDILPKITKMIFLYKINPGKP